MVPDSGSFNTKTFEPFLGGAKTWKKTLRSVGTVFLASSANEFTLRPSGGEHLSAAQRAQRLVSESLLKSSSFWSKKTGIVGQW